MAMTLKEIRQQYPDYNDLSDTELADKLHSKFYADLPKEDVYRKLDVQSAPEDKPLKMKDHSSSLMSDLVRGVGHSLNQVADFGIKTPGMVSSLAKHFAEHPLSTIKHTAGQVAAATGDATKEVANIGLSLASYAAEDPLTRALLKANGKEIPAPQIPENTGVEKALGLEATEPEDRLVRAGVGIYGAYKGLFKPVGKAIFKAATSPGKEQLFQRALKDTVDAAKEEHNLSKEDVKALKDSLTEQFSGEFGERIGKTTPSGLKESINVNNAKIEARKPLTEIPEEKVGEIPPAPDVKGAEKRLADALEHKRSHSKHGGRIYKKQIEEDKHASSKLYNDYRADLKKSDIKVNNSSEIKDVTEKLNAMKDADELAPGYGSGTTEQKALEDQLSKLQSETVNAEDVFDLKRTLDHMADEARDKQNSGVNDIEYKHYRMVADKLESKASRLGKLLESVGGKEAQNKLKAANKGWSNYSAAKNHPVGRKALKEGMLAPNTISKLESAQRGTDYLNEIKDSNPELQKHILSQTYGKPSQFKHLLEPKEEVQPYLANREDLQAHIENLRETKHQSEEHKKLSEAMTKKAEQQIIRQKAIKETEQLERQNKFHESAIPKIEAKIKVAKEKGLEHAKLDKELKDRQQNLSDNKNRLKKIGKFILEVKGGISIGKMFGL